MVNYLKRNLLTIADAISVEVLNSDTILAAIGNELRVYRKDLESEETLGIRLKAKIHGIEINKTTRKCVIFGEKEFALLEWNEQSQFTLLFRAGLSDWISSARLLKDDSSFVLLTAHSVLLRISYAEPHICKITARASCKDKSTLYCGSLFGDSCRKLVIFGGNAFGELLIWGQPPSEATQDGKRPLLQRLQAHNGVIFSINYNEEHGLLTTTSDDRSVRIWKVTMENRSEVDWTKAKITMLASGYGHLARVFQGRVISYDNTPYVITVGEDSYFCLWNKVGNLLYKRRMQFGAIVWNCAYDESRHILYTVGSTGNLSAFQIENILKTGGTPPSTSFTIGDPKLYVSKVKWLNRNQLVGITNVNSLVCKIRACESWQTVFQSNTQKFTVLEVHNSLVAICGFRNVKLFSFSENAFKKVLDDDLLPGLVRSFLFLNDYCYLISDDKGHCALLEGKTTQLRYDIALIECREPWLTSGILLGTDSGKMLLVSNRMGNLLLYAFDESTDSYKLCDRLNKVHGNLGVTAIKVYKETAQGLVLKTTGHDNSIKTICLDKSARVISVFTKEVVPVAWVETIESCEAKEVHIDLVLGFNDNHFVVWSRNYDFLLEVPCGGGHRSWHYCLYEDQKGIKRIAFSFVQHRAVVCYDLELFNETQISLDSRRNKWHTKPCNAVCTLPDRVSRQQSVCVASCGDDNLLKISSFEVPKCRLVQQAEIHSHISNIRAMKVLNFRSHGFLIFSCGGRAQICLTEFSREDCVVREVLSHTIKAVGSESASAHCFAIDPETRLMSIDVYEKASNEYIAYLACSDGFLRKIRFDLDTNAAQSLNEVFYGRCLLQVRLIAELYVLAAATDGRIHLYDLDLQKIDFELPLHESGINALDLLYEEESKVLHLLTGGDDQAVHYAIVDLSKYQQPHLTKWKQFKHLHTSQVTAVALQRDGASSDKMYAVSSGVDQALLKIDLGSEQILQETHSCVADIKGLCLTQGLCLLYGCGLQIYQTLSS